MISQPRSSCLGAGAPFAGSPGAERAGFMLVQTVESLFHRFAAHTEESSISRPDLVSEMVTMLRSYLSCNGRRGQSTSPGA